MRNIIGKNIKPDTENNKTDINAKPKKGKSKKYRAYIDFTSEPDLFSKFEKLKEDLNKKSKGRDILPVEIFKILLPKFTKEDFKKLQLESLSAFDKIELLVESENKKNGTSITKEEYLNTEFLKNKSLEFEQF